MLKAVRISNLTVFARADLRLSEGLNIIIGENGAGKTHLLKVIYATIAASYEERRRPGVVTPTKAGLQSRIAEKLVNVLRPETLGRLARRKQGRERCDLAFDFADETLNLAYGFATNSKTEVLIGAMPTRLVDIAPAYIPTRDLLTIYPGFLPLYESHYLEFEETWRDTCVLLGAPLQRGPRTQRISELSGPLEEAMGGSVQLDGKSGRFYLVTSNMRMEVPLVAEGVRKLGMVARLIATGALLEQGYLFWDEPEANLNPKLIRLVAKTIVDLSANGIQVFVATHSLFLLREIEIITTQMRPKKAKVRFFGLQSRQGSVHVLQGGKISAIGDITALDQELQQSDRFLGMDEN